MESIYQLVSDSMARHGFEAKTANDAEGRNHSLCHPSAASAAEGSMHPLWPNLEPKGLAISNRENQQPRPDHLRLDWSRWIRCESSFSFALAPAKPGIIALGEEIVPAESDASDSAPEGRPSLAQRFSAGKAEQGIPVPEGRPRPPAVSKRKLALFQISETDDLGMALGRLFLPGNQLREQLASGRCFVRYAVIEDAAQRSAATAIFQRWMQDSAETASGIQQQPCGADTLVREEASTDVDPDSSLVRALPPSISSVWGVGFTEVQNREAREAIRRPQPLPSGF